MLTLRLAITLALLVGGYIAYQWYIRHQLASITNGRNEDPILRDVPNGRPAIVYFTTPNCLPCKTQQQPALSQLKADLGDNIHIIEIDATQQPDDADRWGVMSAPTTFILDTNGFPKLVNHGVADVQKLKRQTSEVLAF